MTDRQPLKETDSKDWGELAVIIRNSFMLSQGLGNTLHVSLFNWLVINGYVPDSLPKEIPEKVRDIQIPSYHTEVSGMEKGLTIDFAWEKLLEAKEMQQKGRLDAFKVLDDIIIDSLKRDTEYLERDGEYSGQGRPQHEEKENKNSQQHKFLSIFRKYFISKEKSEHPFSDELGRQIRQRIKVILDNPPVSDKFTPDTPEEKIYTRLNELQTKWEEKNNQPFYPQNFNWND